MRLSTDEDRDKELALETIAAAAEAGITVFDTARAYGRDESDLGHNERLLARALRRCGADARARIVTKGGMSRPGGAWIPDGRAKAIHADCEASLAALDGLAIDLYLIHAPDPRTPWRTSVRALARLVDDGLARRVGLSNVNRVQLDEALELAPVAAVEVALSPYDDRAVRGGVVERCAEAGITVIAHSPLGGPRRASGLARQRPLADVAAAHGAASHEVALAWLLELSPSLVAIPGARRPETARSAARAATVVLAEDERTTLDRAFGRPRPAEHERRRPRPDADVVLVMGIPGAGKTRVAEEYLTRASRSYVIEAAARHRAHTRCVWLDTPLAQAQVNLVERLLDRFGALPAPEELRELAKREPGVHAPTSQMRAVREVEPPATDEGFAAVERMPFVRTERRGRPGLFVAAAALEDPGWKPVLGQRARGAPHLVFEWLPDGTPDALAAVTELLSREVSGPVEAALCPHGGGPPKCWCRPPLPGLPLEFARAHGVDPARSILIGTSPAHRTLAATLGAAYVTP